MCSDVSLYLCACRMLLVVSRPSSSFFLLARFLAQDGFLNLASAFVLRHADSDAATDTVSRGT